MNEQQEQLAKLIERRDATVKEINSGENQLLKMRELVIRLEGAIEAFDMLGVTLEETESD